MLKEIKSFENPYVLIVTPLLTGHKISKETKKSIKRNECPYVWVSYEGGGNTMANAQAGYDAFKEKYGYVPRYLILLDRDIILGRNMIDRMVKRLYKAEHVSPIYGYCYCTFEFKGVVNKKFDAIPFDPSQLIRSNYISSNSLIRTEIFEKMGGYETDNKYKRLLDWATWLKFYRNGVIGAHCPEANFVAISEKESVSSGDSEDYRKKYERVYIDYIEPILKDQAKT